MNAAASAPGLEAPCLHCGLPIPPGVDLSVEYEGEPRPVCCAGCLAVCELILGGGFSAYYVRRDGWGAKQDEDDSRALREARIYDDPEIQRDFVRRSGDLLEATLAIEGMHCAACAWLIERHLGSMPGVLTVQVNLASQRARIVWNPEVTQLSRLFQAIHALGYRARPFLPDREEERMREEQRRALRRLGVAGLGMAQVMMFAIALYAGELSESGMEAVYRSFLRWSSLVVAGIVVAYSARPFFAGALRDLRLGAPGMDVPVALAIGIAFAASAWATVTSSGEVYFDAVCMFTFFLGLGRFLEMRIRQRSQSQLRASLCRLPETARRLGETGEEVIPARALEIGDRVLVRPGETFPADGRVLEGESSANEALLTGEAAPRAKRFADRVIGGSQNIAAPLVIRVERTGAESTLAMIAALLDRAQAEKPAAQRAADRWARIFVAAVIVVSIGVGAAWWLVSPADALWVVLSVLVVTCPCALSLATPAALASATHALTNEGFLVTGGHVLETLARATHVVFDKTGTLTESGLQLAHRVAVNGHSADEAFATARALEERSEHPIARAFNEPTRSLPEGEGCERLPIPVEIKDHSTIPNQGVSGRRAGRRLRLGRPEWAAELYLPAGEAAKLQAPLLANDAQGRGVSWLLLADEREAVAWFGLEGRVRPGALETVEWLRESGLSVSLLSGDPSRDAVRELAVSLGIEDYVAGASPEEKLRKVEELERAGAVVVAVGDGVNDAPLLGRADVSIAMGGGTDLTRISADAVLLGNRLAALPGAILQSRRTRRIIRQNLAWAVVYNLAVLPLAAFGYVPPYLAAIGMSASSLGVVANALRLGRVPGER